MRKLKFSFLQNDSANLWSISLFGAKDSQLKIRLPSTRKYASHRISFQFNIILSTNCFDKNPARALKRKQINPSVLLKVFFDSKKSTFWAWDTEPVHIKTHVFFKNRVRLKARFHNGAGSVSTQLRSDITYKMLPKSGVLEMLWYVTISSKTKLLVDSSTCTQSVSNARAFVMIRCFKSDVCIFLIHVSSNRSTATASNALRAFQSVCR